MFIDHIHETSLMSDLLNLIEGSPLPSQVHLPLDFEQRLDVILVRVAETNSLFLITANACWSNKYNIKIIIIRLCTI